MYFTNQKAVYLKELNSFFMNFKGRVCKASIKNSVLIDPDNGK